LIALVVSIMAVYGLTIANFSLEDFLYSIGINELFLENVAPWAVLLLAAIILWKFGFGGMTMIFGGVFIILGLLGMATNSEVVYNWEYSLGIGFALLILGLIIKKKFSKIRIGKIKGPNLGKIKNPLKGGRLAVFVEGRRITYPSFTKNVMTIVPGKKVKISVENIGSRDLKWKMITGKGLGVSNITRDILGPRKSEEVQIKSDSVNKTKFFKVSAIGRIGRVSRQKITVIVLPGGTKSPPPKTNTPRPTRSRSNQDLQDKYDYYVGLVKAVQKKNKGKIPKLGTPEGDLRHRHIQAIKTIENTAKKQRYKLK